MNNTSIVACAKKKKFPSLKIAAKVCEKILKKHPDRKGLNPYRCVFCEQYHLGNKI